MSDNCMSHSRNGGEMTIACGVTYSSNGQCCHLYFMIRTIYGLSATMTGIICY